MQISITGRHVDVTEAMRDYAHSKVEHALSGFPRIESVHVILDVEKYRHHAEVVVQAKNHIRVDAQEVSDDMYVSIDRAVEKAQKQLRRLRDKVQDHKAKGKRSAVELEARSSLPLNEDEL